MTIRALKVEAIDLLFVEPLTQREIGICRDYTTLEGLVGQHEPLGISNSWQHARNMTLMQEAFRAWMFKIIAEENIEIEVITEEQIKEIYDIINTNSERNRKVDPNAN